MLECYAIGYLSRMRSNTTMTSISTFVIWRMQINSDVEIPRLEPFQRLHIGLSSKYLYNVGSSICQHSAKPQYGFEDRDTILIYIIERSQPHVDK